MLSCTSSPPVIEYGSLWFNTTDRAFRIYDKNKWVTYEETDDPTLKELLKPFMDVADFMG